MLSLSELGRTGLKVTAAGLGGGGMSRLGDAGGTGDPAEIVRRAYRKGIRLFDSAESYGTEGFFREGLREVSRGEFVLCSKLTYHSDGRIKTPEEIRLSLEGSLKALGTDYLDIYYVHGCTPEDYPAVREQVLPALEEQKRRGAIRAVGITELFQQDRQHEMALQAVEDPGWDVMMAGFNLLNQSAVERLFPRAGENGIGLVVMFAVRQALRSTSLLEEYLRKSREQGDLSASFARSLLAAVEGSPVPLPDLAYRFCRDSPGTDTVLFGTGSPEHLEQNIRALEQPPLPADLLEFLRSFAGAGADLSGQFD